MKTRIFLTVLMIIVIMGAIAQNPAITLTFTAEDNGQHVPLDSIHIENLTQGCDTNLYAPDTVLVLPYITGIGYIPNTADNRFSVSQNYPNPFSDRTRIDLFISEDQKINIHVRDLVGRELSRLTLSLQKGAHSFTIYPGKENIYLLTISGERASKTRKLLNAGSGSERSSQCKVVYNYTCFEKEYILKAAGTSRGFTFELGDLLRYKGYAIALNNNPGSDTLEDTPLVSTFYEFEIIGEVFLPTVITDTVLNVTNIDALIRSEVTHDGGDSITARGVCWSISPDPTLADDHTSDGSGTGIFMSYISGLTADTLYYVRAYATNSVGTAYGNEIDFTTTPFVCGDQIADIDGNLYETVEIGTQCWMKENLKTTAYNNGIPISNVTDPLAWANLTTGAYVWYNNDLTWKDIYGALYNWYTTVNSNNLCPTGWHVPTLAEFQDLTNYIGGAGSPHGNELKSCRQVNSPLIGGCNTTEHPRWNANATNYGTDDYGFSGIPGGIRRVNNGTFDWMGYHGAWWSTTVNPDGRAHPLGLRSDWGHANTFQSDKKFGFSVRCLRD